MNRTHRASLVIEFFGLPGSGKSTIANMVAKSLAEAGLVVKLSGDLEADTRSASDWVRVVAKCVRHTSLIRQLVAFLSCTPSIVRLLLSQVGNRNRLYVLQRSLVLLKEIVKQAEMDAATGADVRIVNQGIVQAVVSLGYASRSSRVESIKNVLRGLIGRGETARRRVFVYVSCAEMTSLKRAQERPTGWRWAEFLECNENVTSIGTIGATLFEFTCHLANSQGSEESAIRVDNNSTDDLKKATATIIDLVGCRLERRELQIQSRGEEAAAA